MNMINEQESEVRREWLLAAKIFYFGLHAPSTLLLTYLLILGFINELYHSFYTPIGFFLFVPIIILMYCAFAYIPYLITICFAYEHSGTKWLTCVFISNGLYLLIEIFNWMTDKYYFNNVVLNGLEYALTLTGSGFFVRTMQKFTDHNYYFTFLTIVVCLGVYIFFLERSIKLMSLNRKTNRAASANQIEGS